MTWDELTQLLTGLARQLDAKVNTIHAADEGMEAVVLHLPLAACFSCRKHAGTLNIDVYQRDGSRPAATEYIPLEVLTPELVRDRVEAAYLELVGRAMHARCLKQLFKQMDVPMYRDVEGAG